MLCEIAFYGGLLGAKRKKKLLTADVKIFAVAPSHACFWKRTCNLAASELCLYFSFYLIGLEKERACIHEAFVVNVQYIYFERADLETETSVVPYLSVVESL